MEPNGELSGHYVPIQNRRTILLLFVCRVPEAFIYNMLFTYIAQLATWLQISTLQAGVILAAFTAGECLSSSLWGWFSDVYGRRVAIILGLIGTAVCSLFLGIADRFWKCVVSRLLAGLLNGNLSILQTLNVEHHGAPRPFGEVSSSQRQCDNTRDTNVQHGQVAIQLGWLVGSVIGAVAGGFLANAPEIVPWLPRRFPILDAKPFLLPGVAGCFLVATCLGMAFLYLPETLEDKSRPWNDVCCWLKCQFSREVSPEDFQHSRTMFPDDPDIRMFVDNSCLTRQKYMRLTLIVLLQAGHLAGSDKLMPDLLTDHGWAPSQIGGVLGLGLFVQVFALLVAQSCGGYTRETYCRVTIMYPLLYICIYLASLLPRHMWTCAVVTLNSLRALAQSVVIPSLGEMIADSAMESRWRGRTTGRSNAGAYAARLVVLLTYGPLQDFGRGLGFADLPWCFNAIVALISACVLLSTLACLDVKSARLK